MVVRTYDVFGLKQLGIAEEGRAHHAGDGAPKLVVVQELCDEWRNADEFHAGHNVRTQLINLLLGDECLIDLPEPRQLCAGCAHISKVQHHASRQLVLDADVVMLSVGSAEVLLRNGQHRKSGRSERVWPTGERKGSEEVRQKRRVQHDIAGDIANDGFVEQSVARAENGFSLTENVPGQSDSRSKVVMVAVIDAADLILRNYAGGFECL